MIYSKGCEYAIRALTHLARHSENGLMKLRSVADAEDIPYPFMALICQKLVSAGLLRSARGPRGGYGLTRDPSEITLFEIKAAIDGVSDLDQCAVGLHRCSEEMPCPLHDTWKAVRRQIEKYLRETTLARMGDAVERKRSLLAARGSKLASPR
jgi:Rrf2 family iron-sulfur cluster assembly transcriptional regulator